MNLAYPLALRRIDGARCWVRTEYAAPRERLSAFTYDGRLIRSEVASGLVLVVSTTAELDIVNRRGADSASLPASSAPSARAAPSTRRRKSPRCRHWVSGGA